MNKKLILSVILVLLLVVFSVQNSSSTNIHIFFWTVPCPVSLLMVILFIMGLLTGVFILKPSEGKSSSDDNL
ncbi:MAG: LapA family protein [Bacteroidales bacterium]